MDNSNRSAAQKVKAELEKQARTVSWLADRTHIPYSTLYRKVNGRGEFTATELALCELALEVNVGVLMPDVSLAVAA
jgi:predicted transcriptional regulator